MRPLESAIAHLDTTPPVTADEIGRAYRSLARLAEIVSGADARRDIAGAVWIVKLGALARAHLSTLAASAEADASHDDHRDTDPPPAA